MKKTLSVLLAMLLLLSSVPFIANAATVVDNGTCGENLTWRLDSNGKLTITGNGAMTDYHNYEVYAYGISPFYYLKDKIELVNIGGGVTSIGSWAFDACSSLTSVTIGNSVTSIGGSAFKGCSSLTNVMIPDSVTSIGSFAFADCYALESVTFPDSVTSIGNSAFAGCYALESVTFPDSVTSIGNSVFEDCNSLTSVTIPNSVMSIGNSAFAGCYALESVTIGSSVTSIGDKTFFNCSSLTSVTIPDSVTSIGSAAFHRCNSLASVTIPNGVTSISIYAFFGCSRLNNVYYTGSEEDWNAIAIGNSNDPLINATKHFNHVHEIADIISIQLATCTQPGTKLGSCVCGYSMTEELPILDHTPGEAVTENEVGATCKVKGSYDEVVYCTECGDELSRTPHETAMLDHTPGEAVTENEVGATCKAKGSYDSVVYCAECGDELKRTPHETDMLQHVNAEPMKENEIAASCTTVGSYDSVTYCAKCGDELNRETVYVSVKAHTEVIDLAIAATCTKSGLTEGTHCSVCSAVLVKQQLVPMHGHDFALHRINEPTCTEDGSRIYVCRYDASHTESEPIAKLGHTDADNDGICDRCKEQMTGGEHCKYCGKVHDGAFGWLVSFFHKILAIFKK